MKKREWFVLLLTGLALAALLSPTSEKLPGETVTVAQRTIEEKIEAVGLVQNERIYPVAPLASGKLRLFVKKGEFVRKGQALFEIENADYEGLSSLVSQGQLSQPHKTALELYTLNSTLSPAMGSVVDLNGYDGMVALSGTPLLAVASRELLVSFLLPQAQRENLKIGQKIFVNRSGARTEGEVLSILPSDIQGQYKVEAAIPAASAPEFLPGMQVDLHIVLDSITAPSVPLSAVKNGKIYCVVSQGIEEVPVRTGLCDEMFISLLYGPVEGTQLLLNAEDAPQ
ncbi:MAG: efflux RND transporter periplasmic adaptor subunit [Christensenellaceae bacterium]|jgi:multidrug efflux pump subunit AcrA (membrane-fusion protein)|nr:efflux RND transporter periplasmic adaptor subunit [Christensenellaceae bacterium]